MRAMQLDPDLLLLDEPCASLDTTTTYGVEQLLHTWLATDKRACIFTSHDVGQIERFASRIQELIP
ncbi:MAG TPA: ABC transporter, partial [Prochlorococcaceae cyanobacterium Fu_MAG_134]|nr:ABC transporter [Prochlorococcaceae cyanobacterium Fu_MAG_134]